MNRQARSGVKLERLQSRILARKGLIACGKEFTVAFQGGGRAVYTGADRYGQRGITAHKDILALTASETCTIALMRDGSLQMAGMHAVDSRIKALSHYRVVSCSETHIAVLLGNGRVLVGCEAAPAARDTSEWPAVTDVVCGKDFTAGLTPAGRIVCAGGSLRLRHALSGWEQIAGLFTDSEGQTVYGITEEGHLRSTSPLPRKAESWKNLVFVAASGKRICGVTATGSLCSTYKQPESLNGKGVFIACAVSTVHTVALTREGSALSVGENSLGQCDTLRFGGLFESFDLLSADRRAVTLRLQSYERRAQARVTEAERYRRHLFCGERFTACITAEGRVLTTASFPRAKSWASVKGLSGGNAHLVALHENGTVSADGNDTDGCTEVAGWDQVRAIAAGGYHTLGVTEDGRVLFCGRNDKGQGDVTAWSGIRRVYAADDYTVGLGYDGTLHIAGQTPFRTDAVGGRWNHPIDVAVTDTHMAALYEDGTVLSTCQVPASDKPGDGTVWDTCGWEHVRAIAAGEGFTVGLRRGGQVIAVGRNDCGQCDVSGWRDVVAIACGKAFTLGLTAEGRVLSAGKAEGERLRTDTWRDVVSFTAGTLHAAAMTRSGAVLCVGEDRDNQCSATARFTLFRDARQLYGYGRLSGGSRRASDQDREHPERPEVNRAAEPSEESVLPFTQFAHHLRADTDALLKRLAGSDSHLSVLCEDGTVVTYRYEQAELVREPVMPPVSALRSLDRGTVYVYADGTARLRDGFTPSAPLSALPDKLGDSPFRLIRDLADGGNHYAVLLSDGTVRAFGENDCGQCDTGEWRHVAALAVGSRHTVGLCGDGTAVAAGGQRESYGRGRSRGGSAVGHLPRANPCAVEDWTDVRSVFCAGDVTLGLRTDGRVLAVGNNLNGQCDTDAWRDVVSVASSGAHTVGLRRDGRVLAIGRNASGECATETWSRVIQIAVLPELTLGLRADGTVLAAGRYHRVLQNLNTAAVPVRAIACFGSCRQVFVMGDGTLRIHTRGSEFLPDTLSGIRLFAPSAEYSVLTRFTGNAPSAMVARSALSSFAVGMGHQLSLGQSGCIRAKGTNDGGQCDVRDYTAAVQVAAGHYHSAILLADGRIVLSGRGSDGRCDARSLNRELDLSGVSLEDNRGGGSLSERDPALLPYAWRQVACGMSHTAALRSDGRVFAVGDRTDGRCDTRQWRDIVYIACGMRHTVGVALNGSCAAVGNDRYGQCRVSHWQGIILAAAGEYHTVGLRADGRVEAVGDNRKGQCRVEDLRDIVSVACLPEATLCVTADGRVILRGEALCMDAKETERILSRFRDVVAIHTCEHRIAALTVDRRVICPEGSV